MSTTEHTINDALAELLKETRSLWRIIGVVRSENTDLLKSPGKRPDILILEQNVSPVVIETEVIPAPTVETDARDRLGEQIKISGLKILSSVVVRLPARFRDHSGTALRNEIINANDIEMALYTGESPDDCSRWPSAGWVLGNYIDLSVLAQSAAVPPAVIEQAANKLEEGISGAAAMLTGMAANHHGAMQQICEELHQQDDTKGQTRKMASTILANALVFHESLSRGEGDLYDVRTIYELRGERGGINKGKILEDWRRILKVNYWPIFDIARRILEVIPADTARPLMELLATTAEDLVASHMMRSHDLTGAVFQRLIADREFLAAYYTHPASAALLVGLAIDSDKTPANGSWSKAEDVTASRIVDFACGTGTLLSAAYRRVSQLHEAAGGDAELIHPDMMANALIGCDVLPAAAHLTASMLAGAHPKVKYNKSSIMTVGYGARESGGYALGSLDLLDPQRAFDIIAITAKAAEGMGEKEKETWEALPHESFDLVIMNPPFTRDTDHSSIKAEVPNPMFAAFSSKATDQKEMAKATKKLLEGTSSHGNAGEASSFLVLADRKVREGGTIAMVMPLSLMSGEAWEASRQLLRKSYSDLILVSISGARPHDLSFSADTGMAECLLIAKKSVSEKLRATYIILAQRPNTIMSGQSLAGQVLRLISGKISRLEDGPVGGSDLYFGDDHAGYAIDGPIPETGPWKVSRMRDGALAQVSYQLATNNRVWLPTMNKENTLPLIITTISCLGTIGPVDRDINGTNANGTVRGPFTITQLDHSKMPTYPILWAHQAERERYIEFDADSEATIRHGKTEKETIELLKKVEKIWSTASHCHVNRGFQFNSQSTPMQYTLRKTLGGRAWPSVTLATPELEKTLVLWGNSSLGLLLFWWHASKQQAGRGNIGVSSLGSLPVLDLTKLSAEQISQACYIFEDMKHKELRPVNEITLDKVRAELDRRLYTEVLGFPPELATDDGPLALLRQKLAMEPSITGSKKPIIY